MKVEAKAQFLLQPNWGTSSCIWVSHDWRFTSCSLVTAIYFTTLNLWMLMREEYSISCETPPWSPWCCSYDCSLHPGILMYFTWSAVAPLLRPADKSFSCYVETSHLPSLLGLRSTLANSQTAGCVLKSIYNSNGQVIVCGERSFLLWRAMGAALLCPMGSAAECYSRCLTRPSIFCGLMLSVMLMGISNSAEATGTSWQGLGGSATEQETNILCGMEKCKNAHSIHAYNRHEKYLHENRLFLSYRSS